MRSLLTVRFWYNSKSTVGLLQFSAMWRVCHVYGFEMREEIGRAIEE
jgi:hypothetical protein